MKGRLFVLEGLDGSGKATQTARLAAALTARGRNVRAVSFPDYDSPSSALVKMYLGGAFGDTPGAVNAWAASTFYAVDRYASYKTGWESFYRAGGLVLADRYTTSNIIHQCAKLEKREWAGFVAWLRELEYGKMGIPAPDRVLFLDVEPAVSRPLLQSRGETDIHERDFAYLEQCRAVALWCVESQGWVSIQCTAEGQMLPVDEISGRILKVVEAGL